MIIVFGSINMDINIPVRHLPKAGETVLGPTYLMSPGGKGSNQALAAGRMGVKVAMAGKVGDDGMGIRALHSLRRSGVMTSGVGESELPTGCAVITRDARGSNHIVVAVGANADIADDQIPDEILKARNWLMVQGEVPLPATEAMIRRAHARNTKIVLNFAPVVPFAHEVLKMVDIVILNEFEAEQALEYLGLSADGSESQARALASAVNGTCIITVGEKGSIAATHDNKLIHVPALSITEVVDSAGAGDAYCGTLIACLHEGKSLVDAMRMAAVAGSLSCLQPGTQESFPYQGDIEANLDKLGPHTIR